MILGLALSLALAGPAPPPAAAHGQEAAASQVSLADAGQAIAASRLDQARQILGVALAAGVKGEPVDRLLADLAYASGDYHQAIRIYGGLLASHPDEPLLLERAGISALRLGRAADATALLDRATRQAG
ncbi:MAG TPA: tetratricopeptide repeat protein, partial [Sphingomicrobium sp.]